MLVTFPQKFQKQGKYGIIQADRNISDTPGWKRNRKKLKSKEEAYIRTRGYSFKFNIQDYKKYQ